MNTKQRSILLAVAFIAVAVSEARAQHPGDVWVGRSDLGQLKAAGFALDDRGVFLPPSAGLFPGWSDNDPGFDRIVTSQPADDLYTLSPGAQIRLEVVSFDPAFRAVDNSFNLLDAPGEQTILGTHTLHTHLTWNININDPLFDADEYLWEATFRLVDTGSTGYAASGDVTLKFVNVDRLPGDVNGDDSVDAMDIPGFVALLIDDSTATREERYAADLNLDRRRDGADIQGFIAALLEP